MKISSLKSYRKSRLRALFGLTPAALGELLIAVLPELCQRRLDQQQSKPTRKRAVGGGRKRLLKPYQEVLLTLVYLRHNVAFGVVGQLFGVSADVAENTFHEVVGVLRDVCPANRWEAEKRWTKRVPSWHPDEIDQIIVDTFETPIPRPSIEPKQRQMYSGKKKDHTLKSEVFTDLAGEILDVDAGHRGPQSDQRIHQRSPVKEQFPNAVAKGDLGYKGVAGMQTPHKKPKGAALTPEQKEENRQFSSTRVRVEHSIRRIKSYRIMRDEYRLATGLFAMMASSVVGLVQLSRLLG